ncbi:MAG: ParB N-terminal domain-containing protein [Alphaproteobacteria bacterium]|nr:ParB N-terminal domain-containing protein [Alphaproteobacteria bacterium]
MTETPNILKYQTFETNKLIEYIRNPRNNDAVVDKMVDCITEYGFRIPIVAKSDGSVVDGHLRLKAAKKLGLKKVPVVLADDLTEAQIKAFRLVANQSANWAEWDKDLLRLELLDLKGMDFDLNLTGFDLSEVDRLIQENKTVQEDEFEEDIEGKEVITKPGDIWILGNHRLMCGDAKDEASMNRLMSDQVADMVFTHLKEEAVTEQLPQIFENLKNKTKDGSLFFIGTDWQRMYEIMSAGRSIFDEYKQLCVWNKGIEQQAELYKNQLELFFVFKKGEAKHTNNFGLTIIRRYQQYNVASGDSLREGKKVIHAETGELVPIDEVKKAFFSKARIVRDGIFSIADRLSSLLASVDDPSEIHEILMKEFRTVLEELSRDDLR